MARERRGAGSSLVSMETPYYKQTCGVAFRAILKMCYRQSEKIEYPKDNL